MHRAENGGHFRSILFFFMLPEGWERCFSKSQNREYFHNKESKHSVWKLEDIIQPGKRPLESKIDSVEVKKSKQRKLNVIVIVPFRDLHEAQKRKEHLDKFIPYMDEFLKNNPQVDKYHVLIVEQCEDGKKFNRGKLLNIGFKFAIEMDIEFDSFIFHDVDLLPQEPLVSWYSTYPESPLHIAKCWGRYNNNAKYFGGIVAFNRKDFINIDGFPNTFWGWGGEDDELEDRVRECRLEILSPPKNLPNSIVDLEQMDLKTKLDLLRGTDWKCNVKWEVREEYSKYRSMRETIPWWGLQGIHYKLLHQESLSSNASKITVDVLKNFNADNSEHWANDITSL